MINLTVNEIIYLHEKLLNKTGGMTGIRDFGMLESAVYSVMQCFEGQEFYPTPTSSKISLCNYKESSFS